MVLHVYDLKGTLLLYRDLEPTGNMAAEIAAADGELVFRQAGEVIFVFYDGDTGERVTPFGMQPGDCL